MPAWRFRDHLAVGAAIPHPYTQASIVRWFDTSGNRTDVSHVNTTNELAGFEVYDLSNLPAGSDYGIDSRSACEAARRRPRR